jgi:adenylate cyclase
MIKRKTILFLLIFLCSLHVKAQESQTDSLLNVLSNSTDTTRVNVLNALGDLVFRSEPNEAIRYGIEARELAEELKFEKGLAFALKNIGLGYFMQSNFVEASVIWEQSLKIFESLQDEAAAANLLSNLGSAHTYMGDDPKAVDYLLRSITIAENIGDSLRMATCLMNIGSIYSSIPENIDQSLPYYLRALEISESINYIDGIGLVSFNLGDFYFQKEEYDSALFYFEKSLKDQALIDVATSLNSIGKVYAYRGEFPSAIKSQREALGIAEEIDAKLEMAQIYLGLADTYQKQGNIKLAVDHFEQAKAIASEIESNYELKDAYEGLANVYAELSDFRNAYKFQALLSETEKTIYSIETDDKIKTLQFSYEIDKKEGEIEILKQTEEIAGLQIERQKTVIYAGTIGVFLLILMGLGLYNRYKYVQRTKKVIEIEKDKSQKLLLNILPEETAKELEDKGSAIPRHYKSVSVLFTDFKSFTRLAEAMSSEDLVEELNTYFSAFDDIMEKYGLEKIKTIGDAYMSAGGIPTANETHAEDTIKAGLAIQEYMYKSNQRRADKGLIAWELRAGIHTGPVVAGVVGKKKFAYDIWGDTVNVASRMESNGEAGKVNISAATYSLVKDQYDVTHRGKIEAKNKGEIDMYFVENEIIEENLQTS